MSPENPTMANKVVTYGLNIGLPATQLPGALRKEDPSGQGRTRSERVSRLAAGTLGGMIGTGAVPGASKKFLAPMLVGGAASVGGELAVAKGFQSGKSGKKKTNPASLNSAPGETPAPQAPMSGERTA